MIFRLILFIIALYIYNPVDAQIGAKIKEQEYGVYGTWSNHDFPFPMTLVLNPDGSAEFDGGELKYKVEGNKLILTEAGKDVNYSFKVQSDVLSLSDGDLEGTVLFERKNNEELSDFENEDFPEDAGSTNFNPPQLKIGKQIWVTENLNVTKFRNGDSIQEAKTNQEWKVACKEGRPCWSYYNNEYLLGKEYGILYNWFAINDPRGLAPVGWHIPNNEEWMTLVNNLDCSNISEPCPANSITRPVDNGSLKRNYENCFTRLHAGYRNENGKFMAKGISSNWWSSTAIDQDIAGVSVLRNWDCRIQGSIGLKLCGASVRCVKDYPVYPSVR
ncbi:MAG TPA: fibrobacter succinogenes major paralogous domain-containing protein [Saprospiraceae bacterium]|nr:fibrobacter succinogenes major paralogous domain-containing protein [Saprospiraceae bacterium]